MINNKILVILILSFLLMGTLPVSAVTQQDNGLIKVYENNILNSPSNVEYVPGEIIVKFKSGVSKEKISNINSKHGNSVIYTSPYAGFKRLHIPKSKSVSEMVEIYSKNPNVEYAIVNSIANAFMSPNDPLYHYQWHLDDSSSPNPYGGTNGGGINIERAWDISDGTGVVIAVLDTGVAYENYGFRYQKAPDLANTHFVAGWDFVNNDAHPNDDNSHGTHVTGTIAQSINNGIGVAGVAFNSSIMPVKVLNNKGSGTLDQLVDGIYFATDNGADVISMSLGWPPGYDPGQPLSDALDYADSEGVTIFCAAGNDGAGQVSYPAAYDKCIAVGATRYDETRASYSNYGSALDIMAPGGDNSVDQNGDDYADGVLQNTFNPDTRNTRDFGYWFFYGTSMATPHVSGVAALLIANGVTGPQNVRAALLLTAEDKGSAGWDSEYGYGIVDAYAALNYALPPNNPPIADAGGPYSGSEGAVVNFNGSGSVDLDGFIVTYEWDFGDDNTVTGMYPVHTYVQNGTYTVTLNVTDNRGYSNINTTTATISDTPPEADFTATPPSGQEPLEVTIADTSNSNDGIIAWEWDFDDDGDIDNETQNPVYVYPQNGTYNVSLTVYEADGDSNTITKIDHITVTIDATEPPAMHIDSIEMLKQTASIKTRAVATVTVVDIDDYPVLGAIVSGHWSGLTTDIDAGETDVNGKVALNSNWVKRASGTFTFNVDYITHSVYTYNTSANVEDQDSIIVP
ncbi:MAG: S8 family serine peptidase [Anaerolineaceae bacterium]|nr:S8 family serine peptidase [Anaerolineaceae bacterium]